MSDVPARGLWIDNEMVPSVSGATFATTNPATGEVLAEVAEATAEDVARAVESAHAALASKAWRRTDAHKRSRLLWRLADLIERDAQLIAETETRDNGKPIFESRYVDVPSVVENFRYFAGLADKIQGEIYFGCAETDSWAPPEMVEGLDGHLAATGINYRIEWYPGTGHGFVFPQREGLYHKASAERHWERLFAMFSRNL